MKIAKLSFPFSTTKKNGPKEWEIHMNSYWHEPALSDEAFRYIAKPKQDNKKDKSQFEEQE